LNDLRRHGNARRRGPALRPNGPGTGITLQYGGRVAVMIRALSEIAVLRPKH